MDTIEARRAAFETNLASWRAAHSEMTAWEALHGWTAANLAPAFRMARDGSREPWPGPNFASSAFPRLWLRSPIQAAGEIDKVVGFPILSPRDRDAYWRLGIDDVIDDDELRAAITRRIVMATIQPASSFMNAIRERLSIVERSGGKGARNGPGYINGAAYSPRVLIALINIWRVHYNFFDWRPFNPPTVPRVMEGDQADTACNRADELPSYLGRSLAVPGKDQRIAVPVRRSVETQRSTPAMRMGIVSPSRPRPVADGETRKTRDRRRDDRPHLPDLSRILYQPWLFHGTPMWAKLQGRSVQEKTTGGE